MNGLDINLCLPVTFCLFIASWTGLFIIKRNLITAVIALEIMFLSAGINFALSSVAMNEVSGQVFAFLILIIAAAKLAVVLAVIMVYHRYHKNSDLDSISSLRG